MGLEGALEGVWRVRSHLEGVGCLRRVAELLVGKNWLQDTTAASGGVSPTTHLPQIGLPDFLL